MSKTHGPTIARRQALWRIAVASSTLFTPSSVFGVPAGRQSTNASALGGLLLPDSNGVRLLAGFSSRVIARSGDIVPGTTHIWHHAPDGGATFAVDDGGWIYCCNAERSNGNGGVGAIRFAADGSIVDAYSILDGTSRNCAGGATPWGTWLSCEEVSSGTVWECDPFGSTAAVEHLAMGTFNHEAVAVDPVGQALYLTEDRSDGRFYRFTPTSYPDVSAGLLEVAQVEAGSGNVSWLEVPNPNPGSGETSTRDQVPQSTAFDGGEGIVYHDGAVFFTTKGDNRVWKLSLTDQVITIVYDNDTHPTPILTGVDNITATAGGNLIVAEDGGDLQLVVVTTDNEVFALAELPSHTSSEITGPAFSPDGNRLYFNSQRGTTGSSSDGVTFEIVGPFEQISGLSIFADSFEGR